MESMKDSQVNVTGWKTVKAAAEQLQVDEATIYRSIYRGQLIYAKSPISKIVLIEPNQLNDLGYKVVNGGE